MVIIAYLSFPAACVKKSVEAYKKLPKLPDYMTMHGTFLRSDIGEGIKTINIFVCDNSRIAEAFEHVNNQFIAPFFDVPDLTYSCDVWLEAGEALKMVGLG